MEYAEDTGVGHAAPARFLEEPLHVLDAVMRDDLGEVEIGVEIRLQQKPYLGLGVFERIRPAPERHRRDPLTEDFPQLPGELHAPRRPDDAVSTKHRQRLEAVGGGA